MITHLLTEGDLDRGRAARTRAAFCERFDDGLAIIGTHVASTPIGRTRQYLSPPISSWPKPGASFMPTSDGRRR